MSKAQLLRMIELVIVLVVVFLFLHVTATSLLGYADQSACRYSASAMAKTKVFGFDSPIIKELNCRTQFYRFEEKAVKRYEDGKYRTDIRYKDFSEARQDYYVKKVVADQLYTCWNNLGRGPIDPFGEFEGSHRCVVCSQFEFDDSYNGKRYPDFQNFLKENYVNDEIRGAQVTYWDFLTSDAKGDFSMQIEPQPFSVVFVSVKTDLKWQIGVGAISSPTGVLSCAVGSSITEWLGAALDRASPPGSAPSDLYLGGSILGNRNSRGFVSPCKYYIGKEGFAGLLGAAFVNKGPSGEVPAVVGVGLIPTADVAKECDKLYG